MSFSRWVSCQVGTFFESFSIASPSFHVKGFHVCFLTACCCARCASGLRNFNRNGSLLHDQRSHRACLSVQPALRMSANSLIQRHGISYSRVNVCGQCWWAKPSKSVSDVRIQKYSSPMVRNGYASENKWRVGTPSTSQNQIIQNSMRSSLESWKLWQKMSCSVKEIGQRRGLTEFQVYEQICECVQQGKDIDWFDLCKEAGFSPAVVWNINEAKAKAVEAMNEPLGQRIDEFGLVPVQCGPHVTDVHVLLYNTMMACGITPQELFRSPLGVQPIQVPEKIPSRNAPLPLSKAIPESKRVAAAYVPAPGSRLPNVKSAPNDRNPGTEEADARTTPKRLTRKHMLQWMTDKNGVTLMEIILEFHGYNECQLMRLILALEREKLIQLSSGIFRVTSSDEVRSM